MSKTFVLAPDSFKESLSAEQACQAMQHGIEKVFTSVNKPLDIKEIGNFLKWIVGDVIKEESDTLKDNGLEPKDVNGAISNIARNWFLVKWNDLKNIQ